MSLVLKGAVLIVAVTLLFIAIYEGRDGQVHAQPSPSVSASVNDGVVSTTLSDHDSDW